MPISAGTTAGRRALPPVVLRGGRVLSPSSRDASSLAFDTNGISWIGQDAPAGALFPDSARVDAENAWIAPPFVERTAGTDAGPGSGPDRDAASRGVLLLTAEEPIPTDRALAALEEASTGRTLFALRSNGATGDLDAAMKVLAAEEEKLGRVALAGRSPSISGLAAEELAALSAAGADNDGAVSDEARLAELARLGVTLVLDPLSGGIAGVDLIALTSSGVPLACACRDAQGEYRPWDAVAVLAGSERAGTGAPARPLSPRAAFTAATRGAARAIAGQHSELGVLRPGAPSTLAMWRTGELVARAADDAVQRWSTDPRSGVPPMPDLDGPAPDCLALVEGGELSFTAGPLSGEADGAGSPTGSDGSDSSGRAHEDGRE
ncbi:amidohydrolase [Dietzia sp.]|uniref:amidohydrolase n=1 Tax=Dietzia sp. TaxID=1871616 RepID=UPI002FDAACB2